MTLTPEGVSALEVRMLGTFELSVAGEALPAFPTRTSKLLFAYLVLHRKKTHTRDGLAGLFWGDHSDQEARKRLRTAIWRVKKTLEVPALPRSPIRVGQNDVSFQETCDVWVDVEQFEHQVRDLHTRPANEPGRVRTLELSMELYKGDMLEGEYAAWALLEQDRLRAMRLELLELLLSERIRQRRWNRALACGRELLRHDPLVEHVHRSVMAIHYLAGNRPQALRHYALCEEVLRRELDVSPMHRTRQLYEALLDEEPEELEALLRLCLPATGLDPDGLTSPVDADGLARLRQAAHDLGEVRSRLLRSIDALGGATPRRRDRAADVLRLPEH